MTISTEDLAGSYPIAVGVATAEQWPTEPGEGVDCAALMCEANGFDPEQESNLREPMVQLIKIVEGFYA
ncbi:MAG: hypothetical protein EBY61_10750, partial [Actinobacteria bacterium]|nr:hypothetical protein [Actinomycetota bacterium]